MAKTKARITPANLRWARERTQLSFEALADKLNVNPEQVASWEEGVDKPTVRQAQMLAEKLYIPLGYLFLSELPEQQDLPLPDLRTVRERGPGEVSPAFRDLINDALRKQEWYREYRISQERDPLPFVGSVNNKTSPPQTAETIKDTFGITSELRREASSWEEFLRLLIRRVEHHEVLVFRNHMVGNNSNRKVPVSEFRGFAISDAMAPIVFINSEDAQAAQIFTMMHELAHIFIGEDGISNIDLRSQGEPTIEIERFCNQVAAEALVPRSEFIRELNSVNNVDEHVERLAREFRVSRIVILRRALDLDYLTWNEYTGHYDRAIQQSRDSGSSSGGDPYNNIFARHSRTLTEAVVASALEGTLLYREAASLLGVKPQTIDKIADRIDI